MRSCCCSFFFAFLLLLLLLHLITLAPADTPSLASFARFLFNFVFIILDVARNSSGRRVPLYRTRGGGYYTEEEIYGRRMPGRFGNLSGTSGEYPILRYDDSIFDNESIELTTTTTELPEFRGLEENSTLELLGLQLHDNKTQLSA